MKIYPINLNIARFRRLDFLAPEVFKNLRRGKSDSLKEQSSG